ncbi:MAG: glycoside hydrolase family 26 protein [Myxococcota bacterium]|nr:glycoside hydrolase family 26 protein [Myxococcota bacterium]
MTPNATQQTKNALCYLYSQYGNHILSGQEENATGQPSGNDVEFNYVFSTTGKYPAIRAFDVNNAGNDMRCLAQWNAGGLCMFGYHMGLANGLPDGYQSSKTGVSINAVLTEGSALNTTFKGRMDKAAGEIQAVHNGNGVVIWRPFHEAGGTWFWWSMEGGAQYVRLWKYMFNYMTMVKGLTNILWLLPYDGSPDPSFYPGKAYVDIGGADTYNSAYDYSPSTALYDTAVNIFGPSMPIALHECGPVPDPDQLQSTKTRWSFFSIWTAPFPEQDNTAAELQKVYGSAYVVTRDKVANLR